MDSHQAIPQQLSDALADEWGRLSRPGAMLSGADRLEVAHTARAAYSGARTSAEPISRAAAAISAAPASIRRTWVEEMASEIGYPTYVEVTGVVARLTAVDTVHRALGLALMPLPEPRPGDPTGNVDETATRTAARVPMVGGASMPSALSLVPAEMVAQEALHGPLYLTYDGMADLAHTDALTRAQMELVAARTSAINECFFWVLSHSLMLRASAAATSIPLDARAITDPSIDPLLPAGGRLLEFTDAALGRGDLALARKQLELEVGIAGVVAAAGVVGNFEMMNRVADATGMPVGPGSMARTEEWRAQLGLDRFRH